MAKHIIIDEKRITVPISATEIRHMSIEEAFRMDDVGGTSKVAHDAAILVMKSCQMEVV